ncbi:MAG: excinuclease ABC subunit UvrC [Lachnospiraceae bacterium]|jgi:excinuclease ABC subunit C|nr:excinuclease ABC subunit UvrC [Lachnospiraceae bacterium]MEE3460768.1 excinuclease ABC subunit UvrC [Lachnospiraceae bacterium]
MFDIKEELKKLPARPGVYLMHDKHDAIIYVGKARILKNRVRQYFQESRHVSPKIEKMISQIDHFEYIVTDSEVEALVLESNLIKEHSPKYNTMLRDDKSYPFIKATLDEPFPRLFLTRNRGRDNKNSKNRFFGPYTSVDAARDMLKTAQHIYHIRTCHRVLPRDCGLERACLNYHIRQCDAPCQGNISEEEYRKKFAQALKFIQGDYEECIEDLTEKMNAASERMEFEDAAVIRDTIANIRRVMVSQKITDFKDVDRDIIAAAASGDEAVIVAFFVREGKIIGRDKFHMKGVDPQDTGDIIQSFIMQYYGGTPYIPSELYLESDISDRELVERWLSDRKKASVKITVPLRGQKEKLMELAHQNAEIVLKQDREKIVREEERTSGAMSEICSWIGIPYAKRVESYDISNTSGYQSVGSMVVFEDGKPDKSEYRKFKIMSVKGPDDYASMEEILTRRFEHGIRDQKGWEEKGKQELLNTGFAHFPDLILMDGGRGQVNVALKVLDSLGLDIPVAGLVKDDRHRTRGIIFNDRELPIDTHSEGFWLITRIQDEVHRFAIEYHRSLRSKVQVKSSLDDIEGVGPKRRRALMKHFKGIEALRSASVEDIMECDFMDRRTAENIYRYFNDTGT